MTKKRVFVSYDYDNDHSLKGSLIGQSRRQDSPFSINDVSLQYSLPEETWISEAQRAISRCDVFIVILGQNTHSAPGVLKEIKIAKGLQKRRFQLRPQRKTYGSIPGAGDLVIWTWTNLKSRLS